MTPWLRIMRLQFYPMTFVAYTLGAVIAKAEGSPFRAWPFFWGFVWLFILEWCTILVNERYDLPTDTINKNASPFTGGSRVLVEKRLAVGDVKRATMVLIALLALLGLMGVLTLQNASRPQAALLLSLGVFLGLGYTMPPIKLCYRGFGEIVVAVTHSPYVIVLGFVLQGGAVGTRAPWIISIALFFAVLAAITLAGIPDHVADWKSGKITLSVLLGQRAACYCATTFSTAALIAAVILWDAPILGRRGLWVLAGITVHWALLVTALFRFVQSQDYDRRIDGIMELALTFILWFGIPPLIAYL